VPRIAVITDIHHGPPIYHEGVLRKLGHRALGLTADFVAHMNSMVRPDAVVHLGDAIEDESAPVDRGRYREVIEILNGLDAPLLHATGNHDEINLSAADLHALRGPEALLAPVTIEGHDLYILSTHSDLTRCWVEAEDLDRLFVQLHSSDNPAILFTHHPIDGRDLTGNFWFEALPHLALVENAADVRELLDRHPRVRVAVNGHVHWSRVGEIDGRRYVSVQSVTENIAPPDREPVAAAAWALLTLDGLEVDVQLFGNPPASLTQST
jgi:calcineurin-like phosphoesterase family protein